MNQACASSVTEAVQRAIAALDLDRLEREYWDQNEFLYIPQFLPREFVEAELTSQAQELKSGLNRNYIPGHKKGGSVSYYQGSAELLSLALTRYALIVHADGGVSVFEDYNSAWTHLWREYTNTDANIRLGIWPWTLAGGSSTVLANYFRVGLLPYPFNGEWATAYAASPSGSYTGTGDQLLDVTLTAPGTISTEAGVKYRVQDVNNYWRVYFNTSGALRVDSVEAGVATNRANVAGMISGSARALQ
jgi:hypothetical protein